MQTLPSDLTRSVSLLLEDLGTPTALKVAIQLRYGDWDGIATNSVDPRTYLHASRYAADAAAVGVLKKLKQLPSDIDKRQKAIEKWWDGEKACYKTNQRLCRYLPEFSNSVDRDDRISEIISEMRKKIFGWLGACPPSLLDGRFGPGATFSDRGRKTTVPDKMSSAPVMTRNAIWYLPQWLGTKWGAFAAQRYGEVSFTRGNRYATVPKTAQIDRSIASEPSLNVFYQLSLGREIRHRLRRNAGWDLDTAQEIHRQVAEESSVSREYCTLDLSNASDTVACSLVELLLPHSWFSALSDLRSPMTLIDQKWVRLEKFSSMGNGFTFELETLIFAALACVASKRCGHVGELGVDVFVFGDDIIVNNDVARPLKSCLEFFGFSLNEEKSFFADEPFRESCGADFFNGSPVRPYFLKESPDGPQDYFAFANGIYALTQRLALAGQTLGRRAWFSVLDSVPTRVRMCRGPSVLGDVVLHDDDEHRHRVRWENGIRYYRALLPDKRRVISFDRYDPDVVLACATYGTGGGEINGVIPRDGVLSYKVGWVAFS